MVIKDFKEMECPICGEYYFSDDLEDEKNEPDYEGKLDDQCSHCGWKYDLYQFEHPETKNLTNEMSLNEYKEWFKNKLKENPNYDYFDEHFIPTPPHKCPICGKYEFPYENSFYICPYCGREDDQLCEDEPDLWGGANDLSFNDFKKDYQEKIFKNPNYKRADTFKRN